MPAEVISIGDELTSGQRLDTNSQWLSQQLAELGVRVLYHTTVGDDLAANVGVFRAAIERADIIVASGGLGPTADDLTRQALADTLGVPLIEDAAALEHIRRLFSARGRAMPERNVVQAQFPAGAMVIPNAHGSAPGIDLTAPRADRPPARLFALPGVPAEMKEMWSTYVAPALRAALPGPPRVIRHQRLKCFGAGESRIEELLPDLIRRGRTPSVGITASQATITLRVTAEGESDDACWSQMAPTLDTIRHCLGALVYGAEDDELEDVLVRELAARGRRLAVADAGTHGLIARGLARADRQGAVLAGVITLNHLAASDRVLAAAGEAAVADDPATRAATLARRAAELFGGDVALAIDHTPPAPSEQPGLAPPSVAIATLVDGDVRLDRTPLAGHPEIILPRLAKHALNVLRLRLLGLSLPE